MKMKQLNTFEKRILDKIFFKKCQYIQNVGFRECHEIKMSF